MRIVHNYYLKIYDYLNNIKILIYPIIDTLPAMKRKAISTAAVAIIVIVLIVAVAAGAYFMMQQAPPPAEKPPAEEKPPTKPPAEEKPPAEKPPAEQPPKPKFTEIPIGLVEPTSGAYAVFGTEAKQAAELIIEDINNRGGIKSLGGAKLVLKFQDSKSSVDGAQAAANYLVSTERVPIIVGAYISRHTGGMLQITEPNKVIVVADALVDPLTEQGDYIFRVCPKNSAHAITNVKFVYNQLVKHGYDPSKVKVAVLNEDSIFGKLGSLAAIEELTKLGMNVVTHIEYPYDITDMTSIVNQLMQQGIDIVFIHPYFGDALLFAKTVRDLGYKPMFIAGQGACGFCDPESIKSGGENVNYITNTYSYDNAKDAPYNNWFVQEFEKRYGKKPTEAGGIIAYSIWTIKEALEKYGEMFPEDTKLDPDHLKAAFLALDITSGPAADLYPTGHIKFNDIGDNQYAGAVVVQVIDGVPYLVWPEEGAPREAVFPRPDWQG